MPTRRATALALTALALAAPSAAEARTLRATLDGPRGGDRDGSGTAEVRTDLRKRRVCFALRVRRIGIVTTAHVHRGATGPVAVTLIPRATGLLSGCVNRVAAPTIRALERTPRRFAVDVHTTTHARGALRGTLR